MASIILRGRNPLVASQRWPTNLVSFYSSGTRKDLEPVPKNQIFLTKQEIEQKKKLQNYITVEAPMDVSPISGVPEEHTRSRRVRIFEPAKNAMQSGTNNIQHWEMEFDNRQRWENPLMGWCSSGDPHSNLKLEFNSCEEAIAHCEKNGWNYFVEARPDPPEMRPKSYGINFAWNKRTRVSTK